MLLSAAVSRRTLPLPSLSALSPSSASPSALSTRSSLRFSSHPRATHGSKASSLPRSPSAPAPAVALASLRSLTLVLRRPFSSSSTSSITMGAPATGRVDTADRVHALRKLMADANPSVDAYIIPSEDEYASEYPADADLRRGFISGFNGSAGCAVVTKDAAALFTDGRYFLQAEKQLDPKVWTLMQQGEPDVPTWQEYLYKVVPAKSKIGIDPTLISADDAHDITKELASVESTLIPIAENLVDKVWTTKPARPSNALIVLDKKYTGRSYEDKVSELREELKKKKFVGGVANMLDEVAWLFNLRGSDVPFNPVFFSFALVLLDRTILFIDPATITDEIRAHLGKDVEVEPLETFYDALKKESASLKNGEKVLIGKRASLAIQTALGGKSKAPTERSIIVDQKSIKNATELSGFRASHIRDGAALALYFAWLEEELSKGTKINEYEGSEKLLSFREKLAHFRGPSFTTISSTGPNGSVIHYSPPETGSPNIDPNDLYLCDSGGQYTDGTTDVTRTWHFETPSEEQKRAFTRVLQGHIAIDRAVFPRGTTGFLLDVLARRPLWGEGLDYRHGTGHGVGSFLNVHEGPMGIGTRAVFNDTPIKEGNVLSIEPGFYKDGAWGIRIENLAIVKEVNTPHNFGKKGYLGFERITMCPVQVKLIDAELLDDVEREWVRTYHAEVLEKVGKELRGLVSQQGIESDVKRAIGWLERECGAKI
ncbi:hypothetical protein A4X06_0g6105 [Tilletia controversa]|uniref:Xaa-Pro aminopeptidase P n=1 Tax=Tilletia controversa TaxID=13291 RepID=A0A8X7MQ94_9BASI|nr:hypothetical protein CF328_g5216 [Tilletia controversa]KAE8243782.1 hypothetical protein A4X06_0g6105 [Tilletia controversa]